MPTNPTTSRLRHEAREHRAQAKRLRATLAAMRGLPLAKRDPVGELRIVFAINERVSLAKRCDTDRAALAA